MPLAIPTASLRGDDAGAAGGEDAERESDVALADVADCTCVWLYVHTHTHTHTHTHKHTNT